MYVCCGWPGETAWLNGGSPGGARERYKHNAGVAQTLTYFTRRWYPYPLSASCVVQFSGWGLRASANSSPSAWRPYSECLHS